MSMYQKIDYELSDKIQAALDKEDKMDLFIILNKMQYEDYYALRCDVRVLLNAYLDKNFDGKNPALETDSMILQTSLTMEKTGQYEFKVPVNKSAPKPLSVNEKKSFKKRQGLQNFGIDKANEPNLTEFF